jgi:hypothetical protein
MRVALHTNSHTYANHQEEWPMQASMLRAYLFNPDLLC